MTVHLTEAQEQQLVDLSAANGVAVDELAQQAVDQFLLYRRGLEIAVEEGRAAAQRGELYEHDKVVERIQRVLAS